MKIENNKLRFYHILIPLITIPVFILFSIVNFWSFYSTISDRNGLWESMYSYYGLTKTQYSLYTIVVVVTLLALIFFQLKYLFLKNHIKLNKTLVVMGVVILIFILVEVYLQSIFVGKG